MPTDSGCAPGICQGMRDDQALNCAEVSGCDEQPGYDQYAESRAIVTKARIEMQAENEAAAECVMAMLDSAGPAARRRFFIQYAEARRSDHAANDYAETRLSEMRAQLEALADGYDVDSCDPMPDATSRMLLAVAEKLREVARG